MRQGYITRINLDADAAHRVTLLATRDSSGAAINTIDGVGWDPWAQKLIFTTENANAPTYAATPDFPSTVSDVSGALGRGGYEGVSLDSDGNVMILEDIGGGNKQGTTARIPNSFLFRYVPESPGDLANGKLQVLQVLNNVNHQPITQATQTPLHSPDQVALHVYGSSFEANWVTVHDTAVDGNAPFNANTLAKAKNGTPFKRPENGRFRPGDGFREFYFDETGDTNATSPENVDEGGWCSIFKLSQSRPGASSARLSIFYRCDGTRAGFDNTSFLRTTCSRSSRTPATRCTGSGTRSTRAGSSTSRRTTRPVEPAGPLARRGPRPIRDDRLGGRRLRQERRRQRDHGHGGFRRGSERERTPWERRTRTYSRTSSGASSTPSSTGTTARTRSSRLPKTLSPHQRGPRIAGPSFFSVQVGGEVVRLPASPLTKPLLQGVRDFE